MKQQLRQVKMTSNFDNRTLYHGTDPEAAKDILTNGINQYKSDKGYFGRGFYTTDDYMLARNNYSDGALIACTVKSGAKILDLRDPEDSELYQSTQHLHLGADDYHEQMTSRGIDGLYDRSFGGIVIYNPEALEDIRMVEDKAPEKILNVCKKKDPKTGIKWDRVWIEGKFLLENGITHETRYNQTIEEDRIILEICADGKNKMAGSEGRPIFDRCGKWVSKLMSGATHYRVIISDTVIIEPVRK